MYFGWWFVSRFHKPAPLDTQNLQPFLQPYGYDLRGHLLIGEDCHKIECQHKHLSAITLEVSKKRVMI